MPWGLKEELTCVLAAAENSMAHDTQPSPWEALSCGKALQGPATAWKMSD